MELLETESQKLYANYINGNLGDTCEKFWAMSNENIIDFLNYIQEYMDYEEYKKFIHRMFFLA